MPTNESLHHYQPRGIFSTWLGMVLLFAFFGLLAFVIVKASPRGSDYEKKRAGARLKKLEDAQKENLNVLNSYAWVDKNKGIARIPIDHAIGIMLVELANKKPTAAGPIAAPSPNAAPQTQTSPAASVAPAGSATPAPTAAPSASASATPKPTSVSGEHSEAHNQPAAAANPPSAPPNTQPGPKTSPAASSPPAPAKPQASTSPAPSPSAPGTPLPVRGKTP